MQDPEVSWSSLVDPVPGGPEESGVAPDGIERKIQGDHARHEEYGFWTGGIVAKVEVPA